MRHSGLELLNAQIHQNLLFAETTTELYEPTSSQLE